MNEEIMQTSFNAEDIKSRLLEFCTLFSFFYKGIYCNIDPFSPTEFSVMCGGEEWDVDNIEDVMNKPFFVGRSLNEIYPEITIDEW